MANFVATDGNGDVKYLAADGAGTNGDPNVMVHVVKQATHDNLNANANLQVGNADVAAGNPVPISAPAAIPVADGGGSLTVDQPTRGNLNCNASMQVAGVDVSQAAPVPTWNAGAPSGAHTYTTSADMTTAANVTALPSSGKRIVIRDILVSVGATALTLTFKEQTSGTVVAVIRVPANDTRSVVLSARIKLPTADRTLQCQASAAGQVDITITYYSE